MNRYSNDNPQGGYDNRGGGGGGGNWPKKPNNNQHPNQQGKSQGHPNQQGKKEDSRQYKERDNKQENILKTIQVSNEERDYMVSKYTDGLKYSDKIAFLIDYIVFFEFKRDGAREFLTKYGGGLRGDQVENDILKPIFGMRENMDIEAPENYNNKMILSGYTAPPVQGQIQGRRGAGANNTELMKNPNLGYQGYQQNQLNAYGPGMLVGPGQGMLAGPGQLINTNMVSYQEDPVIIKQLLVPFVSGNVDFNTQLIITTCTGKKSYIHMNTFWVDSPKKYFHNASYSNSIYDKSQFATIIQNTRCIQKIEAYDLYNKQLIYFLTQEGQKLYMETSQAINNIDSFDKYLNFNIAYLAGGYLSSPSSKEKIDEDLQPLVPILQDINRNGFLTLDAVNSEFVRERYRENTYSYIQGCYPKSKIMILENEISRTIPRVNIIKDELFTGMFEGNILKILRDDYTIITFRDTNLHSNKIFDALKNALSQNTNYISSAYYNLPNTKFSNYFPPIEPQPAPGYLTQIGSGIRNFVFGKDSSNIEINRIAPFANTSNISGSSNDWNAIKRQLEKDRDEFNAKMKRL